MSGDCFSPEQRSAVMRAVRSEATGPELRLRRALWRAGARYRLAAARTLPGRPDLAFPGRKLAVFVHGCFWHGHDCPRGARQPKSNREYWRTKIARNQARDQRVLEQLALIGWRACVVWECELKDALPPLLAAALAAPRP